MRTNLDELDDHVELRLRLVVGSRLRLSLEDLAEEVARRSRNDALLLIDAASVLSSHRVGLPAAGLKGRRTLALATFNSIYLTYLTVGEHRGVESFEGALHEVLHAALVDGLLARRLVERVVVGEGLPVRHRHLRAVGHHRRVGWLLLVELLLALRSDPENEAH